MEINSCFQLGYVIKTHGIGGEIVAFLDVDDPLHYNELKSFFIKINRNLVNFQINSISIGKNSAHLNRFGRNIDGVKTIIKLQNIDSIDKAKPLKGKQLYLPLKCLPELDNGQFYYHQVINYKVVDKNKGDLGNVKEFYDLPSQALMSIIYLGKEVLIPVTDHIIEKADHQAKVLHVNLPEGLLEI